MPEVDVKLSDNEIDYDTTEIEEEHELGLLIQERGDSFRINAPVDIPLGYKRDIQVDGEDEILFMSLRTPGEIDPKIYYPSIEWRITMETLDETDSWPQWLKYPAFIDGEPIMEEGRIIKVSYYVIRHETDMTEEEDGFFFLDMPFSREEVKMSDIGLPIIKGSDIIALDEAKKMLKGLSSTAASRRRVG